MPFAIVVTTSPPAISAPLVSKMAATAIAAPIVMAFAPTAGPMLFATSFAPKQDRRSKSSQCQKYDGDAETDGRPADITGGKFEICKSTEIAVQRLKMARFEILV